MEITFRRVYPWAILPTKRRIDTAPKEEEARLLAENFKVARASRSQEFCWSWRAGQEIGWTIHSPVTVPMDAIHDFEAVCADHPDAIRQIANQAGATENWAFRDDQGRVERMHFTRRAGWTALFDFRVADGSYQRMFTMNGQGSVEWSLGWEAVIPPNYSILLLPYEPIENLEVLTGVLSGSQLAKRSGRTNGLSLGVRPQGPVTIQRGQPIARIILLHSDSIRARAVFEEGGDPAEKGVGVPLSA